MAARSEQLALADIVENCVNARQAMNDLGMEAYADAGWEKQYAIERCIEIISEAAKALSAGLRARHPQIDWRPAIGIGNVLRHEYSRIEPDIIWHIVNDKLPALEAACRRELE
jgi:uncharacterized protein with HEPN domain